MSTASTRAARTTFRWIVLLPVLMMGSLLYWSVAIALGGVSLMMASHLSVVAPSQLSPFESRETLDVNDGTTSITVHLEESVEPEDVNDNAGAAGFTQPSDDSVVTVTPGPGTTSF
jgi:hypothetical protein